MASSTRWTRAGRPGRPALDLGNLLAHLDLALVRGRLAPAVTTAFTAGLRAALPPDHRAGDPAALAVWRRAALARLVAVHAFRPAGPATVRGLLARLLRADCGAGAAPAGTST